MRKTLLAAAALAPLWFLASQTSAVAQTTIGNSTSTPQTTAADGDITITGTISPNAVNTAAVTINSNNNVNNTGTISDSNVNNVVGVAIQGGNTGSLTNTGTINITETFTPSDANKDGINEAPFASPSSTGRFGVQVTGASAFSGFITNTGTINVQGDNSFGVSIETQLQGTLTNLGTITYIGDNGAGLRVTSGTLGGASTLGGVTGDVVISGGITAEGANSSALILGAPIGGQVSIYAGLTSTDYGTTTRPLDGSGLQTVQNTPNEIRSDAGSAMIVSAGVTGGIFLGAPPVSTNTSDVTTDADGDGVVDSAETSSSVTTFGSAPAIVIGGANPISIGGFAAHPTAGASTGDNGFGIVIEGAVSGQGVYDGVSSTGLQIGGTGFGTVNVTGGMQITGSVEAASFGTSNATAIHIGAGATVPTIENVGTISASVSPPNSTTEVIPSFTANATAIQIDANASVSALVNSGIISSTISGDINDSINVAAVIDKSGTLSSVTNVGSITASFVADATGATISGAPITLANGTKDTSGSVALDLSNNTSGVTLTQQQAPTIVVTTTTTNGVPVSVVTTTPPPAGTLVQSTVATVTTSTNGDVTVTTTVPASPTIVGDIELGNGVNTVNLLAGSVFGALNMGAGPSGSLTIDNGAILTGAFSYTGTGGAGLALNVNNGTLDFAAPGTFNTSSFKVGSSGVIFFGVDPVNNKAAEFVVSGAASIAAGAKIGLTFLSNATGPQTYTILQTGPGQLTVDEAATSLTGAVPFMFNAALTTNPTAGSLSLMVAPKTAAEMGLNPSQAAALPATYEALTKDAPVQAAFLGQYTKSGFLGVYNQVLPDYAGGTFQAANAASQAIGRATAESNDIENPTGSRGAWAQELFIGVNQGAGLTDGFRGGGFGFVGGVETGGSGLGAFGTTAAFVNTTVSDSHLPGDTQTSMSELELGGYWQGEFSGFVADARVGVGYTWMAGRREIVQTNDLGDITLDRKVKSSWDGYTISGRFGLAYKWSFNDHILGGGWFVQPQTHFDYFRLNESAYSDNEAQGGPALALAYQSRTGQEDSATASIVFGRRLGTGIVWRPQVELGVRDVFSGDAGDTTARYLSGGPSFTLSPADINGTAGIARFKIKASSEYYELGVEAGAEVLPSRYEEGDVKMSVRVLF